MAIRSAELSPIRRTTPSRWSPKTRGPGRSTTAAATSPSRSPTKQDAGTSDAGDLDAGDADGGEVVDAGPNWILITRHSPDEPNADDGQGGHLNFFGPVLDCSAADASTGMWP